MDVHNSTYNIHHVSRGLEAELQRLRTQVLMSWEKEYRTLKWFGLADGMNILEVGSGPGFVTEKLVENLPSSKITALDIDAVLLARAKQLLNHVPETRLTYVQASVLNTGLPDNYYDFVIARLLFLHLHDPLLAAQEILRVLKPGGKLVIIDIDDGVFGVTNPEIEGLPAIIRKISQQKVLVGGNRNIGRGLPRLLSEAGFYNVDMEAIIQHSDLIGIDGFKQQFEIMRFEGFRKNGTISPEQFEILKQSIEELFNCSDPIAMMIFLMACGTKRDVSFG